MNQDKTITALASELYDAKVNLLNLIETSLTDLPENKIAILLRQLRTSLFDISTFDSASLREDGDESGLLRVTRMQIQKTITQIPCKLNSLKEYANTLPDGSKSFALRSIVRLVPGLLANISELQSAFDLSSSKSDSTNSDCRPEESNTTTLPKSNSQTQQLGQKQRANYKNESPLVGTTDSPKTKPSCNNQIQLGQPPRINDQIETAGISSRTLSRKQKEAGVFKPVAKPNGWVKADLVSQAKEALGSFGSSTFDRIRKASDVSPSERGGKGQQRRYSRAELLKIIQAVKAGTFRNKDKLAQSWQELLNQ